MPTEKISRSEAKKLGLVRYFTGKPCKHGHVCERFTASKHCVICNREKAAKLSKKRSVERAALYDRKDHSHRISVAMKEHKQRIKFNHTPLLKVWG